jgi:hypothetical protein
MRTVPGRGIAYVAFATREEASEALAGLHGTTPYVAAEDDGEAVPLDVSFRVDRFPRGNSLAAQVCLLDAIHLALWDSFCEQIHGEF